MILNRTPLHSSLEDEFEKLMCTFQRRIWSLFNELNMKCYNLDEWLSIFFLFCRPQLMWFNIYLTFMQYLQFTYQRGCLYRLRSLGERDDMDITIDGFHSWMWKGNLNYSTQCAGTIFNLDKNFRSQNCPL